ncbi:zinc finger protein ZAT11-like [Rutidosis leptorrhynchoides]|uniref:zinc finger protein ZAT11-like n=1 Tax=Rutidosis leptorrhynchoides TaxID=125765 RepID=UPI003A98FCC0
MVSIPLKRSREGELDSNITNMANYLMLLSRGATSSESYDVKSINQVFKCKTCNRQFPSFQALGGHRTSHKKPRLVDGEMIDHHDHMILPSKPKTHKCSICGLEFAIGQALGGHMRKHRAVTNHENNSPSPLNFYVPIVKKVNSRRVFSLDLNLTPLENDFELRVNDVDDDDEKLTPIAVDFFL